MLMKNFPTKEESGTTVKFYENESDISPVATIKCTWREVGKHPITNEEGGIIARFGYLKVNDSKNKELKVNCVSMLMEAVINELKKGDVVFYWITKRKDIEEVLMELGYTKDAVAADNSGNSVWMFDRRNPKHDN